MPISCDPAFLFLDIDQRNSHIGLKGGIYENVHWSTVYGKEKLGAAKVTVTVAYTTINWCVHDTAYHATVKCSKLHVAT